MNHVRYDTPTIIRYKTSLHVVHESSPLLCLQFIHPLPQAVDKRLLLLFQRVLKFDLLAPQLLQVALLGQRLSLQFLDLTHQLVHQALLFLLQCLFQAAFLLA